MEGSCPAGEREGVKGRRLQAVEGGGMWETVSMNGGFQERGLGNRVIALQYLRAPREEAGFTYFSLHQWEAVGRWAQPGPTW